MDDGQIVAPFERATEGGGGFFDAAGVFRRDAEIARQLGVVRGKRERLAERLDGLRGPAERFERRAEVVVPRDEIGAVGDGAPIGLDGTGVAAESGQGIAEIVVEIGALGLALDRFRAVDRPGAIAELERQHAGEAERFGRREGGGEELAAARERLLPAPGAIERHRALPELRPSPIVRHRTPGTSVVARGIVHVLCSSGGDGQPDARISNVTCVPRRGDERLLCAL
jgi:hypothetical protein